MKTNAAVAPQVRLCRAGEGDVLNVLGSRLIAKSACASRKPGAADASFVFECAAAPGVGTPLHSHPQWEAFYVLRGTVEFGRIVDGAPGVVLAKPGDFLTIPGGVPHSFQNVGDDEALLLVICEPGMEPFFYDVGENTDGVPSEAEIARVMGVMTNHKQQMFGPHPGKR